MVTYPLNVEFVRAVGLGSYALVAVGISGVLL